MNINLINSRIRSSANYKIIALLILWMTGLLSGIMSSLSFPVNLFIQPKSTGILISLFCTFFVYALPCLIVAVSIYFNKPLICHIACFIKAYCCGYTGVVLFVQLGSGAWVYRIPFMFCGCLASVLMLWLALKARISNEKICLGDVYFLAAAVFILCLINTLIISPFLLKLLSYY